jgi:hypothetical protein
MRAHQYHDSRSAGGPVASSRPLRAKPVAGSATSRARLIVDGARVHVLDSGANIPAPTFAGVPPYTAFEVHVSFLQDD